ncbi:MAG TPA: DUF2203 domain-containing protein [Pseudobdellovibrionaceae bacterium]
MKNVIEINRKKVFMRHEVSQLLPLIYRLTEESQQEVRKITNFIEAYTDKKCLAVQELQGRLDEIVNNWQAKIEKLGGEPKGLWLADFDNGHGYFCWKFPETEICFWHGYQDGFMGRTLITEKSRPEIYENSNSPNQPDAW